MREFLEIMRLFSSTLILVGFACFLSLARAQVLDVNGDAEVGPDEALAVAEGWKGPALSGIGRSHFLRDFTVAPGETVSAGDVVAFLDGTVSKGTGRESILTAGPSTTYSENAVRYLAAAALTSTRFVVAYNQHGFPNQLGFARIGTLAGDSIVYGDPAMFSLAPARDVAIDRLTEDRFAVAYSHNGGNGNIRFANVVGDNIDYEEIYTFHAGNADKISVEGTGFSQCVVAYVDSNDSDKGLARIVRRNEVNQMSGSLVVTFNNSGTTSTSVTRIGGGGGISTGPRLVIAYSRSPNPMTIEAGLRAVLITNSTLNPTLTLEANAVVPVAGLSFDPSVTSLLGARFALAYAELGAAKLPQAATTVVRIATTDGTSFLFGQEHYLDGALAGKANLAPISSDRFALSYSDYGAGRALARVGTAEGFSVEFGPAIESVLASFSIDTAVAALSEDRLVLLTILEDNDPSEGLSVSSKIKSIFHVVGTAKEGGNAGETIPVIVPGVSNAHSNLVPGEYYFATDEGDLTTAPTDIPIGLAVSPTEIVLTGGAFGN